MASLKDKIRAKKRTFSVSRLKKNVADSKNSRERNRVFENEKQNIQALKDFVENAVFSFKEQINKSLEAKIADINKNVENQAALFEKITKIEGKKGDKGDKGDSIKGDKGDSIKGEPGKDANEEKIIREVLRKIPKPKDGKTPIAGIDFEVPKGDKGDAGKDADEEAIIKKLEKAEKKPEEIARELETLKGLAKLDYFALKNLPNIPTEGKGKTIHRGGQGLAVYAEDLSANTNGSTKTFTIPVHSRALLVIGSDFPIIYRPTVDFTTAGVTLTLTGAVDAPTNGSTLIFVYAR